MVSFLEGLKNANKAINCFLLSAGGNILGGIASLPGGSPEALSLSKTQPRPYADWRAVPQPMPRRSHRALSSAANVQFPTELFSA